MALVSSNKYCNADTGKLFSTTLKGLVAQCNQCESTPDWIIGAPLDELPLVEQIPILHRLGLAFNFICNSTTEWIEENESKSEIFSSVKLPCFVFFIFMVILSSKPNL